MMVTDTPKPGGDRFKLGPYEHVTFYGEDDLGEWTPYMEKWGFHLPLLGSVWLHRFFRGDADRDLHDHPWNFWTFPLTSYVEEVRADAFGVRVVRYANLVERYRVHFRPATYAHRVVGPWRGSEVCKCGTAWPGDGNHYCSMGACMFEPEAAEGQIWTLMFHRPKSRAWGFWKERLGQWCWEGWRKYHHEGGKSAPCETPENETKSST